MSKYIAPWPLWLALAWVAVPLAWGTCFDIPYPINGAIGLQNPRVGGPLFATLAFWLLLLSFPKVRTVVGLATAAGFLFAWSFVLVYFSEFANTSGFVLIPLAAALLSAARTSNTDESEV